MDNGLNDRELLGLLAGEAPTPRTDLADAVVRTGRRVRVRRRIAAAGAAAVVVAVAGIAVPAAFTRTSDSKPTTVAAGEAPNAMAPDDDLQREEATAEDSGALKFALDPRVALYAAALTTTTTGDLYLADATSGGLDKTFRAALRDALPGRRVQFVRDPRQEKTVDSQASSAGSQASTRTAPLGLGDIRMTGDTAVLRLGAKTVRLTRKDEQWIVQPG